MSASEGTRPAPPGPEPALEEVRNLTPYAKFACDKMGPGRRYYDVVAVKGTWSFGLDGRLSAEPEATPPTLVDRYFDEQDVIRSSVRAAGDVVVSKPGTDVIVTGTARPPTPRGAWLASVRVRDGERERASSQAAVFGPRYYEHRALSGWALGQPEETDGVPIRYELAYGGSYPQRDPDGRERSTRFGPNPVGRGHWPEDMLDRSQRYLGPQWVNPSDPLPGLLASPTPVGFGPVARWWSTRLDYAGTYDDAWRARARQDAELGVYPDYPSDFDMRFFQSASPALQVPDRLRGGETLELEGLLPTPGPVALRLPGRGVLADLYGPAFGTSRHRLPLDTVHVDLDAATVSLCWRMTVLQGFRVVYAVLLEEEA